MQIDQPTNHLHSTTHNLVILPIGSYEQHGPHLPTDTDLRIAQLLSEKLAQSFSYKNITLLPAIPFSCSWEHKGLGTLALNTSTLSAILHDIAYSLKTWEIPILLVIINWHGGNSVLSSLATEITAREDIPTTAIQAISQASEMWVDEHISSNDDVHAGAIETSIIQAYWPELLSGEIPEATIPNIAPAQTQSALQALGIHAITPNGIWGDPKHYNTAKGRNIIEMTIKKIHEQVNKLLEIIDNKQKIGNSR